VQLAWGRNRRNNLARAVSEYEGQRKTPNHIAAIDRLARASANCFILRA
jgi:hypothetical protein